MLLLRAENLPNITKEKHIFKKFYNVLYNLLIKYKFSYYSHCFLLDPSADPGFRFYTASSSVVVEKLQMA